MDVSNIHNMKKKSTAGKNKKKRESLKVVYISSPVMVTTSASRFRALVQELTGKNSDISHLTESNYADSQISGGASATTSTETDPYRESPTSSGSVFDQYDDVYRGGESFLDLLHSNLCFDVSELDVLGSYDAL